MAQMIRNGINDKPSRKGLVMDAMFWHSGSQLRGQQKQRKRQRNKINTKNQQNKIKEKKK